MFLTIFMQAQNIPQPKQGPAPTIKIGKPTTFTLSNGLKVLIVENHKLPRVSFSLRLDNAPYAEGDKKGVADMTSSMIGSGTTKISKDAFNEEVDLLGASINFSADGAYASSLSKYAARVLELMADGALNPNFTQVEFDKQKAKMIEGLKSSEKSVQAVAARVADVLTYSKGHPMGEYVSETTLNNVSLSDVSNNYNTNFVPANAYLVIVGDVKTKETRKVVENLFGEWKKGTPLTLSYSDPKDVTFTQINFVDMPNAVQSEVTAVNVTNLKMTDPDYFPTIVANQILGGDFNSYINMNIREKHGWTYGARSSISGDKYVSRFEASTQVRNAVTDSTIVEVMKEIKRIRTEKVADDVLANVKAGYIGRFVMQIEKPQTVANYALRTQTQSLPADFYENYIKSINAVTADDVMRVANKYFLADNMRYIIVGKAADVLPALENLKMPIFYFDKFGATTTKPALKKAVPAGVTAKSVMDLYIKSVGGETALMAVKTMSMTGSSVVAQAPAPLTYSYKSDSKGKMAMSLAMGPMVMMQQVVGEKDGYQSVQGKKMPTSAADFAEQKLSAVPFEELLLRNDSKIVLTGIEPIGGSDAYAIQDGKRTLFFDVKSFFKVAESKAIEQGGQKMNLVTSFKDYRDVKGVKVPFNTIMNVGIEIDVKITDVKINEGVTDADFQ